MSYKCCLAYSSSVVEVKKMIMHLTQMHVKAKICPWLKILNARYTYKKQTSVKKQHGATESSPKRKQMAKSEWNLFGKLKS